MSHYVDLLELFRIEESLRAGEPLPVSEGEARLLADRVLRAEPGNAEAERVMLQLGRHGVIPLPQSKPRFAAVFKRSGSDWLRLIQLDECEKGPRLVQFARLAPGAIFGTSAAALCCIYFLSRTVDPIILLLWGCCFAALTLARFRLSRLIVKRRLGPESYDALVAQGVAITVALAVLWAISFYFATAFTQGVEIVAMFAIAIGLLAGTTTSYYPLPAAALGHNSILGGAIFCFSYAIEPVFGAMALVYICWMYAALSVQSRMLAANIHQLAQMREQRDNIRLLLNEVDEANSDWLWQTNADLQLTNVSDRFAGTLGREASEVEGRDFIRLLTGSNPLENRNVPTVVHGLVFQLHSRQEFRDTVIPVTVAGDLRWWRISGHPDVDGDGSFRGYKGVCSDVSGDAAYSDEIVSPESLDSLTEIYGSASIRSLVGNALVKAASIGGNCGILVIALKGLDRLKADFGPAAGDHLLRTTASRLRALGPKRIGRLHGAQFIQLETDFLKIRELEDLADQIRGELAQPIRYRSRHLMPQVSIGIAVGPVEGAAADILIHNAEVALRKAEKRREGVASYFPPFKVHRYIQLAELAGDYAQAIEEKQFRLLYDLAIDMQTGQAVSADVQIGWDHPIHGRLAQEHILPLLKAHQRHEEMGVMVVDNCARDSLFWKSSLDVFLSGDYLTPSMINALASQRFRRNGAKVRQINFVCPFEDHDGMAGRLDLNLLRQTGAKLAIDIGTMLRNLPIAIEAMRADRVRLNGPKFLEFDRKYPGNARSLIDHARRKGVAITAADIEDMRHVEELGALGIERCMGLPAISAMPPGEIYNFMSAAGKTMRTA